ncbi:hypothetical protein RHMOL_Rhmol13G0112000 [Rhododendron molle]|uniref:Uncharacterized protein n=1 Tax=Rhododendron molle TaxID=49168 RepID=A0ACC0L5Y8_RHOML|nr:hypothetical protein RHMOL_Rhmol13G0112000 [Rhododendron molle]
MSSMVLHFPGDPAPGSTRGIVTAESSKRKILFKVKVVEVITRREKIEEIQMTEKLPRKESATIAPSTGNIAVQPLTTFQSLAASMLFTLNSPIMNTIKLFIHPPDASVKPAIVAVKHKRITFYMDPTDRELDTSACSL